MDLNTLPIEAAAEQELRNLGRTSFSSNGFSDEEIKAIASAISAAIQIYDEQRR